MTNDSRPTTHDTGPGQAAGGIEPASPQEAAALELWREAEADYENEKRHTTFIVYCAQTGILQFAAERYAEREQANPGDQVASRCKKILLAQAVIGMGAPRPPDGLLGFVQKHRVGIVAAAAAAIMGLLFLVVRGLQTLPAQIDRMLK